MAKCARTFSLLCLVLLMTVSMLSIVQDKLVSSAEVAENTWISRAPMQEARFGLDVAVVNSRIYAIGGQNYTGKGYLVGTNEEYNPVTDSWVLKASMPTPRAHFGIAVYQNKIYVIGGYSGIQYDPSGANEVYDPETDTWENKKPMPIPGYGIRANVVDGKIYVVGGESNATEVYDPITDTWTTAAPMLVTPYLQSGWSCISVVVDGKIHVVGYGYRLGVALVFHEIYDPEIDDWSSSEGPSGSTYSSAGATMGVNASKRIYVFGINTPYWLSGLPTFNNLVYNFENDSWTFGALMPTPRIFAGVAVVNDIVYAIGGATAEVGDNIFASAANEQYTPLGYGTVQIENTAEYSFPAIVIMAIVVPVAVVSVGLIAYFKKRKH